MDIPFLDFILIAARISGMVFTAPVLGSRNFPTQAKIGLAFFLSLILFPIVGKDLIIDISSNYQFLFLLINEILIGVFMGLVITVYFGFIYFAGDLIDRDLGFAMVNVVNPLDESQIAITSNLFYIFATMIFLQLNLHHELIMALVTSFQKIKLGTLIFTVPSYSILLDIVAESFVLGFQIAAPFVITVLIANIILGLLSKAMPGMNIFILGMPFKIFFGFLLFIVLMPYLYQIFAEFLGDGFNYLARFFSMF